MLPFRARCSDLREWRCTEPPQFCGAWPCLSDRCSRAGLATSMWGPFSTAHVLCFGALNLAGGAGLQATRAVPRFGPLPDLFFSVSPSNFYNIGETESPIEWYDVRDDAAGILVFSVLLYIASAAGGTVQPVPSGRLGGKCRHFRKNIAASLGSPAHSQAGPFGQVQQVAGGRSWSHRFAHFLWTKDP